jgi:hypothetical protein
MTESHKLPLLKPWRKSGLLTETRTTGEILLRKNGTQLDIWIRVNGEPQRFSVNRAELLAFLGAPSYVGSGDFYEATVHAESDDNTEEIDS